MLKWLSLLVSLIFLFPEGVRASAQECQSYLATPYSTHEVVVQYAEKLQKDLDPVTGPGYSILDLRPFFDLRKVKDLHGELSEKVGEQINQRELPFYKKMVRRNVFHFAGGSEGFRPYPETEDNLFGQIPEEATRLVQAFEQVTGALVEVLEQERDYVEFKQGLLTLYDFPQDSDFKERMVNALVGDRGLYHLDPRVLTFVLSFQKGTWLKDQELPPGHVLVLSGLDRPALAPGVQPTLHAVPRFRGPRMVLVSRYGLSEESLKELKWEPQADRQGLMDVLKMKFLTGLNRPGY